MATQFCAWFSEITKDDVALAGGKGANLGEMVRVGLPIPPGLDEWLTPMVAVLPGQLFGMALAQAKGLEQSRVETRSAFS